MFNQSQLVPNPIVYASGMQLSWVSTTTLSVTSGQVRDYTNEFDIVVGAPYSATPVATTINGAINGLNGLDTGALGNNKCYAVYAIGDSAGFNPPGFLLSLNAANAPLMPTGVNGSNYSLIRRIGYVFTDGSAHFLKFYQVGTGGSRYYQYDVPISVLSGGSSATFAAVNLETAAPLVNNSLVYINLAYTGNAAGNQASIRPTGSAAAAGSCPIEITAIATGHAQDFTPTAALATVSTTHLQLDYIVQASDALSISVVGYQDSL